MFFFFNFFIFHFSKYILLYPWYYDQPLQKLISVKCIQSYLQWRSVRSKCIRVLILVLVVVGGGGCTMFTNAVVYHCSPAWASAQRRAGEAGLEVMHLNRKTKLTSLQTIQSKMRLLINIQIFTKTASLGRPPASPSNQIDL